MKQLTTTESLDDLVSQHEYSLLLFSATWCGPCKAMSSVVEEASILMNDRINAVKIDVDKSMNEASDYGIRNVPTLLLVKDDEIVAQQVGALPPVQFMQWLSENTENQI